VKIAQAMSSAWSLFSRTIASRSSRDFVRISSFVFDGDVHRPPDSAHRHSQAPSSSLIFAVGSDALTSSSPISAASTFMFFRRTMSVAARDAAFAHHHPVRGDDRPELRGGLERHLERVEVPVVDPDDRRLRVERDVELLLAVDLDQRRELELLARQGDVVAQLRLVEDADDEQRGVGEHDARLPELVLVDDEVLAAGSGGPRRSARRGRSSTDPLKNCSSVRTEIARAPPSRYLTGLVGRVEVGLEHALHGGGALHLRR
jgi:hypothetical protein